MILFQNFPSQFFLGACIFVWTFWGQFGGFCKSEIKKKSADTYPILGDHVTRTPPPPKKNCLDKTVLTKRSSL